MSKTKEIIAGSIKWAVSTIMEQKGIHHLDRELPYHQALSDLNRLARELEEEGCLENNE